MVPRKMLRRAVGRCTGDYFSSAARKPSAARGRAAPYWTGAYVHRGSRLWERKTLSANRSHSEFSRFSEAMRPILTVKPEQVKATAAKGKGSRKHPSAKRRGRAKPE